MKKSKSNAMTGFFLGAATGVVLGLLIAPDKGSNTRKKIRIAADEITLEATRNLNEQTKNMKGFVDACFYLLKEVFESFESNLREGLLEQLDDAELLMRENAEK